MTFTFGKACVEKVDVPVSDAGQTPAPPFDFPNDDPDQDPTEDDASSSSPTS